MNHFIQVLEEAELSHQEKIDIALSLFDGVVEYDNQGQVIIYTGLYSRDGENYQEEEFEEEE